MKVIGHCLRRMSGGVLFKMKELWGYFITAFQGAERDVKKIKKAQHFAEYEAAVSHIFENHEVGLLTE